MRSITMCALALALALGARAQAGEEDAVQLDEEGRAVEVPKAPKRLEAHDRGRTHAAPQAALGTGESATELDEEGRGRRAQAAPAPEGGAGETHAQGTPVPEGEEGETGRGQAGTRKEQAQETHAEKPASNTPATAQTEGPTQGDDAQRGAETAQAPSADDTQAAPARETQGVRSGREEGEGKETQTAQGQADDEAEQTGQCSLAGMGEREARSGERLIETLSRWGEEAGWTIVAKTKYDWPIEAGHRSRQRLDKAILELTESFRQVQPAPKATAYGKNCVIVIRDNAARSG